LANAPLSKAPHQPPRDCPLCPRLEKFRAENRAAHPDYFNDPVPSFGELAAKLLIVGLAPGLKGANRTGRPFTGDYAGDLLYGSLKRLGLARGEYRASADDSFQLIGCRITNAVRCVPPQNKPEPSEIATCRPFLVNEIAAMPNLRAILSLGAISHQSVIKTLNVAKKDYPFAHGGQFAHGKITLLASYHCSRYNTNTGVLTEKMFDTVMAAAKNAAGL
jgi:uracil-DNA glycosylase family 4